MFVDAHLDLSMNAMEWNRDLRRPVNELRRMEENMHDKPDRGNNMVAFPELHSGNFAVVVGTQLGRYAQPGKSMPGASWNSPEQAWAQTQGQLSWYREMEREGHLRQITKLDTLEDHLDKWNKDPENTPIGLIRSLEGADSIVSMNHLEMAWEGGLRAIGPAHYGPGVYAQGTDATGGIGLRGKELLRVMEELNIILDASHLCDDSFWESMDAFRGPVWASHSNCRALVPHNRQISDEQILEMIRRGAVIGTAFDAWMLTTTWTRGKSTPEGENVSLDSVIDHIDHVCQLAGNSRHAAIGSDLDGAYGREQSPHDINTIADLQRIPGLLAARGYSEGDVTNICGENWLNFLRNAWKDSG